MYNHIFENSTLVPLSGKRIKSSEKLETECSVCKTKYLKRVSDYKVYPNCGNCKKLATKAEKEMYYTELIKSKFPKFEILEFDWKGFSKTRVKLKKDDIIFEKGLETLIRNNNQSPESHLKPLEERKASFVKHVSEIHSNKYSYNIPLYIDGKEDLRTTIDFYENLNSKIPIFCLVHNSIFYQVASNHYSGTGCPECARKRVSELYTKDMNQIKEQACKVHNNFYVYDSAFDCSYKGVSKKAYIYCPAHEEYFYQNLTHHLNGSCCPLCANIKSSSNKSSKVEEDFKIFLESFGLKVFKNNYLPFMKGLELDLYIPEIKLAIEFNGYVYHHSCEDTVNEFLKNNYKHPSYHLDKYQLCLKGGVDLIHIWDFEDMYVWKELLEGYCRSPHNFEISFENKLRIYKNLPCYGVSYITVLEKWQDKR